MNTLANGIDSAEPAARADALTADIRDRADPALVRADRVEQLYSQLPLGMAATIVIGVIAAMELHEGRLLELVLFWGGLLALVVVLHALLYLGYRNDAQRHENTAQWLRWLGIGAFAAGATWGFAAAVFFPSHADERQVFMAFLLAGVLSGGIPMYAASWPIFAAYAAAIALPFTYVLATFGNRLFAEIALLIPLFFGVSVAIAFRLNGVFLSGYRLRHAYQRQLVELQEARRQIEASGRKLALFAEAAPIAVLELDGAGVVHDVNHAAEILFGYAADELVSKSVKQIILPKYQSDFDREWAALMASRQPTAGVKVRNPRRDGLTVMLELISIDELLREAMVLNKGFGDRFHVRFESRGELLSREVTADRKRLLQVMTNLLSNAAKFSPEGDVVEISTEEVGDQLRIGVHDRGPGIPEAFRGRIFG